MYGPEIGDMDEGIVEGCKDSGNAENKLSCSLVNIDAVRSGVAIGKFRGIGIYVPSLTWGPREMFSWAGRAAFFGGMVSLRS